MKRAGFTMIELIFVIVILGILAAVALPKFAGVSDQASAAKCDAFVGTLNRTVGPSMWSQSITDGLSGSIATLTSNDYVQTTDIPPECFATPAVAVTSTTIIPAAADQNATIGTATFGSSTYDLTVYDGNLSDSPRWGWFKQ